MATEAVFSLLEYQSPSRLERHFYCIEKFLLLLTFLIAALPIHAEVNIKIAKFWMKAVDSADCGSGDDRRSSITVEKDADECLRT